MIPLTELARCTDGTSMGQILRFKQHNLADEISAFLIPHPDAAIDSDRAAHL
jgi:hypothetical protein